MTSIKKKTAVSALAAFSLLGTLAGCSTATTSTSSTTKTTGSSSATASTPAASTSAASSYKDGNYDETGSYQSPEGTEKIEVKLTLAKGVVTKVSVVGQPLGPEAQQYQTKFAGGIGAAVVGKSIDSIAVSKVAGSSLTSGGFNDAVAAIKADATA